VNATSSSAVPARSLRLNFGWTLLGNIVYAVTQWGILVLLARLGSPGAVGQFSLGLAITAPVMLFASLQLRGVQATDAQLRFHFQDYGGLRSVTTIVSVSSICGIGCAFYRGETAFTIAMFALSKGVESLVGVVYGLVQQRERMVLIAQSLILRGVLALVAVAVCFAVFRTVWAGVCGITLAWSAVFAAFDVRHGVMVARETGQAFMPRFSAVRMKQLLRLSLPLGVVNMLSSFNSNVPRYMLSHFRGVSELGVFSALSYILTAGTMVVGALGQSATPRLALYAFQGKRQKFRGLSCRLVLIGMMLGLCGVLAALIFGRQLITLLYGREYSLNGHLLPWLMIAATVVYMASLGGYSLTAARYFQVQMPLFSLVTVLTLVFCYLMVKPGGAVGAAKAVALVGFIQLAGTMAILRYAPIGKPGKLFMKTDALPLQEWIEYAPKAR